MSYSSLHGPTYKYPKMVLQILPTGKDHILTIPLLMDSKVTNGECFGEQFSKCFWVSVCVHECKYFSGGR